MQKIFAILTLVTSLLSAAPALACGPMPDDVTITSMLMSDAEERGRADMTIDELVVTGDQADVLVSWTSGRQRNEQRMSLERDGQRWRIVNFTSPVLRGTFARIEGAHPRSPRADS